MLEGRSPSSTRRDNKILLGECEGSVCHGVPEIAPGTASTVTSWLDNTVVHKLNEAAFLLDPDTVDLGVSSRGNDIVEHEACSVRLHCQKQTHHQQ